MAKLIVDLPRDWEAKVTTTEKGSRIEIEPNFLMGTSVVTCLYLTSQGNGGMERKGVLVLNGNTGWPDVRRVKQTAVKCDFDMAPEEYEKKVGKGDDDATE